MANYIISIVIHRIILPVFLVICILSRPAAMAFPYLLHLAIVPIIPVSAKKSISGQVGSFYKSLISFSAINILAQSFVQIVFEYVEIPTKCSNVLGFVLRHIGLVRMKDLHYKYILYWTLPDIVIFLVSVICFLILKKLSGTPNVFVKKSKSFQGFSRKFLTRLKKLGIFLSLLLLSLAGIMQPSLLNSLYFLFSISSITWWGFNNNLGKKFAMMLSILSVYELLHLTSLLAYQSPGIEELLDPFLRDLLGFKSILFTSCFENLHDFRLVEVTEFFNLDAYLNPVILVVCYMVNATTASTILRFKPMDPELPKETKTEKEKEKERRLSQTLWDLAMKTFNMVRHSMVSNKSVRSLDGQMLDEEPLNQTWLKVSQLFQAIYTFVMEYSFLATHVSMMAWSIYFHSWFGFVFLIWSNICWTLPDQHKILLKSSTILILYAEILLIITYFCGMEVLEEIPTEIHGINLNQIGIKRIYDYPAKDLSAKILFTVVFLYSKRTMLQLDRQKRDDSASSEARSHMSSFQSLFDISEDVFSSASWQRDHSLQCVVIWIWTWATALTLFGYDFLGTQISLFKVMYMSLFLMFNISFQVSFKFWRSFLRGFWTFVISYSMIVLTLIYSYQFDEFPGLWAEGLKISKEYQSDIGLFKMGTNELFEKMGLISLIIILTGIQINYFHNKFMRITRNDTENTENTSSKPRDSSQTIIVSKFKMCREFFWLFLELHFMKVLFMVAFFNTVQNIHPVHIPNLILTLFGMHFSSNKVKRIILKIITITSSIVLLVAMIFQMSPFKKYNDQKNRECPETSDILYWIGNKNSDKLYSLAIGMIVYIFLVTLYILLLRRQKKNRTSDPEPTVLFPEITRTDADKDIKHLIKFLCNYGFFKFGYEICLILFVVLIAVRKDFFSWWYSFLLITVLMLPFKRLWRIRSLVVLVAILAQYFLRLYVNMDTECSEPFTFKRNVDYKKGALLIWEYCEQSLKNNFPMINLEYLLLLLLFRQYEVHKIEHKFKKKKYKGGDNKLTLRKSKAPEVPDFISGKSTLDYIKKFFFYIFIWVVLTVVFFTGTASIDIFSIGYIAGSFSFFWQGQDFYAKPLRSIVGRWNYLIYYNAAVIFIKMNFTFWGCLIYSSFPSWYCALMNIVKVDCFKFKYENPAVFSDNCDRYKEPELFWDCITFACLIIQRRMFYSEYFTYVIIDTKASSLLASRGADLIEELLTKTVRDEVKEEMALLEKVKNKMEKIKKTSWMEDTRDSKLVNHNDAILSGGYYMFDHDDYPEQSYMRTSDSRGEPDFLVNAISSVMEPVEKNDNGPPKSKAQKIMDIAKKVKKLTKILLNYCARRLFEISRNQIYVLQVLSEEKKLLKESEEFDKFLDAYFNDDGENFDGPIVISKQRVLSRVSLMDRQEQENILGKIEFKRSLTFENNSPQQKSIIIDILVGLFYVFMSYSDLAVYFVVFLNQIKHPNFLNLIMPFMIFFWGTMSVPRCTKTFWVCLIAYVQSIIIIKLINQSNFWWNKSSSVFSSTLIGFADSDGYNTFDLIILILIFFHRVILKYFGLWKYEHGVNTVPTGCYLISEMDKKTKNLIECQQAYNIPFEDIVPSTEASEATVNQDSQDLLLNIEGDSSIIRHEIKEVANTSKFQLTIVRQPENQMIKAEHEIIQGYGKFIIKLKQDHVHLTMKAVDCEEAKHLLAPNYTTVVENTTENIQDYYPSILKMVILNYFSFVSHFFQKLSQKHARRTVDIYTYCFLCDFVNFLVILFGYSDFETLTEEENVVSYFKENRIPTSFFFMLFSQFLFIIVDRLLYLRKNIVLKIIFQMLSVIFLHVWLFILLPKSTNRKFQEMSAAVAFYIIKCIYLLLSAYQIRCGYPNRISGNFLTKNYHLWNYLCFQVFMNIPFLFELRVVMDWLFTDTSFSLFEWFKMESIFTNLFSIKCNRKLNDDFPVERGRKNPSSKIFLGVLLIFVMIALIWFPLGFFAFSGILGSPNIPIQVSLQISFDDYNAIYSMTSRQDNIHTMGSFYNEFRAMYNQMPVADNVLANYGPDDVVIATLSINSKSNWNISPPDKDKLINDLKSGGPVKCRVQFTIYSENEGDIDNFFYYHDYDIPAEENNKVRKELYELLINKRTSVTVPKLLPKFLKVRTDGKVEAAKGLAPEFSTINRKILLSFKTITEADGNPKSWWEAKEVCDDPDYEKFYQFLPHQNCTSRLTVIFLNDPKLPSTVNLFVAGGVIGLYAGMIYLISRVLRNFLATKSLSDIMFTELPNVDRLIKLCRDIYLVRERGEFKLEEELFAKLIFLYRSPETLITLSKPKNE